MFYRRICALHCCRVRPYSRRYCRLLFIVSHRYHSFLSSEGGSRGRTLQKAISEAHFEVSKDRSHLKHTHNSSLFAAILKTIQYFHWLCFSNRCATSIGTGISPQSAAPPLGPHLHVTENYSNQHWRWRKIARRALDTETRSTILLLISNIQC